MRSYDLILRGGTVFDGSGSAGVRADVAITDDRISAIGDLSRETAGRVFDVMGQHIAPGFIDIHTHSDISIMYNSGQASHLGMGVTTQVTGNCSLSMGLVTSDDVFEFEKRWLAPHGAEITWSSFNGFLHQIEESGTATNFVPLAGNGTLRKRFIGLEDRPPTPEELARMQHELAQAMEAGCWGISSGLEYPPSAYADVSELTALCRIVGEYGGLYATHLRNEGDTLIEAVQESLDVVGQAGVPLQLSHHKAEGHSNWGKVTTTLGMVQEARARGLDVQLDQYPYTAFMTSLAIQTLPRWALAGSVEENVARLTDPVLRSEILRDMRAVHPDWEDISADSPWNNIQIGVCRQHPEIQGIAISVLSRQSGKNPMEYVIDLLAETKGNVSAVNFAIGETDIAEVMRYPWTSIGSDGVGTHPEGTGGGDKVHPRAYGTFPRVLGRYVRELGVLREEQAIHKMTGLPAARLQLKERGLLRPGYFADITVYDPQTIGDRATFADPHQYAQGITMVLVNGRVAFEQGSPTSARAGKVLRKNR